MKKSNLISLTELEKLNETELINVKGGVSNVKDMIDASEDSQHHDCENNDHFKENGTQQ
ncbi:MAG: hypothetical protein H9777_06240 [Candidatus Phocaeicola faecigallinarum]|uniref:Uncharacterized protein n=1 Tax=Candidatus Phocaeicola faecigallinarum TaxID=2838732 RepID=A0A948TB17_9BACT|nr:hypothetical protein [Candidatus Phocaeicola faecigallinarum]